MDAFKHHVMADLLVTSAETVRRPSVPDDFCTTDVCVSAL